MTEAEMMTKGLCNAFRAVQTNKSNIRHGVALATIADAAARIAIGESAHKSKSKAPVRVRFFNEDLDMQVVETCVKRKK